MFEKNDFMSMKSVEEQIKESIHKLQAQESNLKESIRQLEIQRDNKDKIDSNEVNVLQQRKEERLSSLENRIHDKEQILKMREDSISNRETMVAKREQDMLNLESEQEKLRKERSNFDIYRRGVMQEVEIAKVKIVEAQSIMDDLLARESSLQAREISLKNKEKSYMDRIGELNEIEKRTTILIEHLEGLKKEMNYV